MEITAGFSIVVGSSLLDAIPARYGMFWALLISALVGLAVALLVMIIGPGEPWNRLALVGGAAVGAGLPAWLVSSNGVSFSFALFLLLIAYWRGISVARERPGHDDVMQRFGFGLGFLFLGLVWVVARGIDSHREIWQMLAFLGIAYTVLTFLALVLARLERSREPGTGQAVALAVVAQLGLIVLVAIGALQLFSYDLVGSLIQHTRPFWDALGATLFRFVTLIADPIQWFINLIRPPGSRRAAHPPIVNPLSTAGPEGVKPKHPPQSNPAIVIAAIIFGALVVGGILVAIWYAIPRLPHRPRERGFTEERRTLSLAEVWQLILGWMRRLMRRTAVAAGDAVRAGRRRVFPDLPADPVRRIYAQMVRRAAAVGVQREPGMTPSEFQIRLIDVWPDGSAAFSQLTGAYVRRRYGEVSFADSDVARLREQWHRLRLMMRVRSRQTAAPVPDATAEPANAERGRRRLRIPALRDLFHLPEPQFGEQPPTFGRSVALAVFSFAAPILLIVGLLAFLAIVSALK
jgi:hypothetical protein